MDDLPLLSFWEERLPCSTPKLNPWNSRGIGWILCTNFLCTFRPWRSLSLCDSPSTSYLPLLRSTLLWTLVPCWTLASHESSLNTHSTLNTFCKSNPPATSLLSNTGVEVNTLLAVVYGTLSVFQSRCRRIRDPLVSCLADTGASPVMPYAPMRANREA